MARFDHHADRRVGEWHGSGVGQHGHAEELFGEAAGGRLGQGRAARECGPWLAGNARGCGFRAHQFPDLGVGYTGNSPFPGWRRRFVIDRHRGPALAALDQEQAERATAFAALGRTGGIVRAQFRAQRIRKWRRGRSG
jgi:hypothetical protein